MHDLGKFHEFSLVTYVKVFGTTVHTMQNFTWWAVSRANSHVLETLCSSLTHYSLTHLQQTLCSMNEGKLWVVFASCFFRMKKKYSRKYHMQERVHMMRIILYGQSKEKFIIISKKHLLLCRICRYGTFSCCTAKHY